MMSFMMRNVLVVAVSMLGCGLLAQGLGRAGLPGGGEVRDGDSAWNRAEMVFIGELTEAKTGPVAQSMPPIYMNSLSFKVWKVLR